METIQQKPQAEAHSREGHHVRCGGTCRWKQGTQPQGCGYTKRMRKTEHGWK